MNDLVLEALKKFPVDGTHQYYWVDGFDGVTKDLVYQGAYIAHAEPLKRTYCCGLTFEVFFDVAKKAGLKFESVKELREMKKQWFVAGGGRKGPVDALVPRGLGIEVPFEEAIPGDFVQLWRGSGTGHSVILINKQPGGFGYWSTQPATNGIGYRAEFFVGANVKNPVTHVYVARLQANARPTS